MRTDGPSYVTMTTLIGELFHIYIANVPKIITNVIFKSLIIFGLNLITFIPNILPIKPEKNLRLIINSVQFCVKIKL
jgi:hypothetical protein